jgi:NAD+ kinase
VPLVGINLGRVGFLAEAERSGMTDTVARVLAGDYTVEKRSTLDVRVFHGDTQVFRTWALNEAAIEKMASRMLEVVIGVDQRPLSSFGCDGVVVATPTGSTAYAFSAGGPVVWPTVSAMVLVPLSAHALFARPLVTAPTSTIVVEVEAHSAPGVLTCDGRRTFELAPGARIVITTSDVAITLARVHNESFTDRLVSKFDLPVTGWRGPGGVGRE